MGTDEQKIASGDLESLLAKCSDSDLAPLVVILLARSSNDLQSSSAYKANAPHHSRYHDLIAREIRAYGGHSVANLFRGEGVPYGELVHDACSYLGIPAKRDEITTNEEHILDFFLPTRWEDIAPQDRDAQIARARTAAAENGRHFSEIIRSQAMGMGSTGVAGAGGAAGAGAVASASVVSTTLRILPKAGWLGLAAFAVSAVAASTVAFDPVLVITLPCIVQIAALRRIRLEEQAPPASSDPSKPPERQFQPESQTLVIPDADGVPALSATAIAEPYGGNWSDDEQTLKTARALSELLPNLPSASAAYLNATRKYMQVVLKPGEILIDAADRAGSIGATRVSGGAGIAGQARLLDPANLKVAINLTAMMAAVSLIVGQAHMTIITQQLKQIKEELKDIKNFQKQGRLSEILGILDYLNNKSREIYNQNQQKHHDNTLEENDKSLHKIRNHLSLEIKEKLNSLNTISVSHEFIGTGDTFADIKRIIDDISEIFITLLLCYRVYIYNSELKSHFAGEEENALSRLEAARTRLASDAAVLTKIDSVARERIQTLDAWTNTRTTLGERKHSLLKHEEQILRETKAILQATEAASSAATLRIRGGMTSATLLLRIENDRVTGVQDLAAT